MTKYLTRDQILNADDLPREEVKVPEWGGVILVRGLNGAERDQLEAGMIRQKGKVATVNLSNFRAKLVVSSAIDAEGNQLFTERDVNALGAKSAAALDRVFSVSRRLSGFSDTDVSELVGNLSETPSEGSTSD